MLERTSRSNSASATPGCWKWTVGSSRRSRSDGASRAGSGCGKSPAARCGTLIAATARNTSGRICAAAQATGVPQSCPTITGARTHRAPTRAPPCHRPGGTDCTRRRRAWVRRSRRSRACREPPRRKPACAQRRQLMPIRVPELGPAVTEQHERAAADLGVAHVDVVGLGGLERDARHRLLRSFVGFLPGRARA